MRDSAPNHNLFVAVVDFNTLRAVQKRSTVFVTDLLHHKEGTVISRVIQRCKLAEGVAQMHKQDTASPDISSAHRDGSFFNLSALRQESSGISHSLCVSLP